MADPIADLTAKLEAAKARLSPRSYYLLKSFLTSYELGLGINGELTRIAVGLHNAYRINPGPEFLAEDADLYCYDLFNYVITAELDVAD